MKIAILLIFLNIILLFPLNTFALDVVIKNDDGVPRTNYTNHSGWEETVFLVPDGPCTVKEIQIYFAGTNTGVTDSIFIVGDASEGVIPPTMYVHHFNQIIAPIVFTYNGTPGWQSFPVSGLRSDGYDRICIQHTLKYNGPFFASDMAASSPNRSFLYDPYTDNSMGFPGIYYLASGDYMVRIVVEYDYPDEETSQAPPAPVLYDVSKIVGLTNNTGGLIGATDVSVVDWNKDGYDDVAIGANFFQNKGDGTFNNVSSQLNISCGGSSWADFDNDGNIDCFSQIGGSFNSTMKMMFTNNSIYKNNGDGTFAKLDPKTTFSPPYPNPSVDFKLSPKYENDSVFNPYSNITPLWFDCDGDGNTDLFLANNRTSYSVGSNSYEIYFPDELWYNNGDGTFSNIRDLSGISQGEPYSSSSGYYDCYGAGATDYNLDNKTDIFVANYRLIKDNLYKNKGDATFQDVGEQTGTRGVPTGGEDYFGHGMGIEWGDYNNDGYPDLAVGNLGHPDWRGLVSNPSLIYENPGSTGTVFSEKHKYMGLKFYEMNAGMTWADLDLDGYLDLWHGQIAYEAEGSGGAPKRFAHIYRNTGAPDFKLTDETWTYGAVVHGPWVASRIDFDHDGDVDLLFASNWEGVKLFRNDMTRKFNWLNVKLAANKADGVNTDCYGTKVMVYSNGKVFYRELMGSIAGTKCTQNSNELLFGLGDITKIDSLVVVYPNNNKRIFTNISLNERYTINYTGEPVLGKIATPALRTPSNFQTKVEKKPMLSWYNVQRATSYIILVSFTPDFANSYTYTSTEPFVQTDFLMTSKSQIVFWKVQAVIDNENVSDWSSEWNFTIGTPSPIAPNLIFPVKDTTDILLSPVFQWNTAEFACQYCKGKVTYQIQLFDNDAFQNPIYNESSLKTTSINYPSTLTPGQKYYWYVRAYNDSSESQWSEVGIFTTMSAPLTTSLLSPENNAYSITKRPTFVWAKIKNAEYYKLEISKDSLFSTVHYSKSTIADTSFTMIKPLDTGTEFWWRIKGTNAIGEGEWSAPFKFKTEGIQAVIDNLDNGAIILNDNIPNPFAEKTIISFTSKTAEQCTLTITDISGNEIYKLFNGISNIGLNSFEFNSKDLSSGIYIYRLSTKKGQLTKKLVIVK